MTARETYPSILPFWAEMCDEIDRARAELDRLRTIIAAIRAVLEDDT